MSNYVVNPYFYSVSAAEWESTGYGSASPTIATVTNTNDQAQPTGKDSSSYWANGTAITLSETNVIEVKATGTTGAGGQIANTIFGLTTLSSASATADVNMTTWSSGSSTGTVAYARINEPAQILTYHDGGNYDESSTFDSTSTYKIVIDGTSLEFFKDGSSIRTATTTAGTYYGFISSYLGDLTGKFQLV